MILGKIIEKAAGKSLNDVVIQANIFGGLKDTGFNPNKSEIYRIAPTEYDERI